MGVGLSDADADHRLLAGLEKQGPPHLAALPGPFVLAFVHAAEKRVMLARDRLGRRRLFYEVSQDGLRWSPSLLELSRERLQFDEEGLQEVLAYRWSQGGRTIFPGVSQLQPGSVVWIDSAGTVSGEEFWTLPLDGDEPVQTMAEWVDRTGRALDQGMARVLDGAKWPFALLSGGVDSSLLAAVGSRVRPDLVAVTPTWVDRPDPELPRAIRFASHLGIEHRVLKIEEADIARATPKAVAFFGGPIRDYHMIVLSLVYERMAGSGHDLVLHGQAADTLFGPGHIGHACRLERKRRWLELCPQPVLGWLAGALPGQTRRGERLKLLLRYDAQTAMKRHQRLTHRDSVRGRCLELLAERDPRPELLARVDWDGPMEDVIQVLDFYQGTISHMVTSTAISEPFGITMGYPFLTPEVLDVVRVLPRQYKTLGGDAKPVLKALGARFYPSEWMHEPKLGFPTPMVSWIRGALRPWIENALTQGSRTRTLLGDTLVDSLSLPDDFELIWTLACLEEVLRQVTPADRA